MNKTTPNSENIEVRHALKINEYASDIQLFDAYEAPAQKLSLEERETIVDQLFLSIYKGVEEFDLASMEDYEEKRSMLHGVINTLEPHTLNTEDIELLNKLLQAELLDKKLTSTQELMKLDGFEMGDTQIKMWQGDISTLKVDAIVNAANNQMMGCWQPLHACIDNVIHTAAGVQLRDDCHLIMEKQGFEEPTGRAKITRAYNLPSKYVLHTVGPIVQGQVTSLNEEDLANSYIHCLEMCKTMDDIRSVAFCGISTGVFGYPTKAAAQIALRIISLWLAKNPTVLDLVVVNVYSDKDKAIYQSLFDKL